MVDKLLVEVVQLHRIGQLTLKQQVRRFFKRRLRCQFVNVVTAVDELAEIPIDIADGGVGRYDSLQPPRRDLVGRMIFVSIWCDGGGHEFFSLCAKEGSIVEAKVGHRSADCEHPTTGDCGGNPACRDVQYKYNRGRAASSNEGQSGIQSTDSDFIFFHFFSRTEKFAGAPLVVLLASPPSRNPKKRFRGVAKRERTLSMRTPAEPYNAVHRCPLELFAILTVERRSRRSTLAPVGWSVQEAQVATAQEAQGIFRNRRTRSLSFRFRNGQFHGFSC